MAEEKEIKGSWILLGIILFIILSVTFVLPIRLCGKECYEDIAKVVCKNRTVHIVNNDGIFVNDDFKCCIPGDNTSRKSYDRMSFCEGYVFFEEEDERCCTTYQFWRKRK